MCDVVIDIAINFISLSGQLVPHIGHWHDVIWSAAIQQQNYGLMRTK